MSLSFSNLDAANRAHAERIGSGVSKRKSDLWLVVGWGLAALLFGAILVALVLPREALPW